MFSQPKSPEQPKTCSEVKMSKKTNVEGISIVFTGIGQMLFPNSQTAIDFLERKILERDSQTGSVTGEAFSGFRLFFIDDNALNNMNSIVSTLKMDI